MKKFAVLLSFVVAFSLLGTSNVRAAFASTNALLTQIAITAAIQTTNSDVYVTNSGVATASYKVTKVKITSQDILTFLSAEFATNFPAGAQLGYQITGGINGFVVLDNNGGLVLDVSKHPTDLSYVFALSNSVAGPSMPQVATGTVVNKLATTNVTENVTIAVPDYGVYYADGHGNKFHFSGLITEKVSLVQTPANSEYKTVLLTLPGTGGGTFFNKFDGQHDDAVFTSALLTGKGANITE